MKLIFRLLVVILISGCHLCPETNKLIGEYYFIQDKNNKIYINPNYEYRHTYLTNNGEFYECSGKWSYNSSSCRIIFEDFVPLGESGPLYGVHTDSYWDSRVIVEGDEIKLMYSSENNIYYLKE